MKSLLLLLAVCGVFGTSFDLSAWETLLASIDGTLPLMTPQNSRICYYFDLSQACSPQTIADLLSLPDAVDISTWVPTTSDCESILESIRAYFEFVASMVFSGAIASAATTNVTNSSYWLNHGCCE